MYDVIVIGVGGMGSATTYHLARRGVKVLGLEQFDIPHELGSSHGVSRIIRLAYAEHPDYVPLLWRSYELWRELENRAGERLLYITGGIDAGARDGELVRGSLRSCRKHRLRFEELDAAAVRRRFPGYRLSKEMAAVYQPDAGFLLPERCIVAHVTAAQAHGAEIRAREPVREWHVRTNEITVVTDRQSYRARKMVITAGPWTRTLVPELAPAAVPERQVLIWTQPLRPELFALGAFPIFNMDAPEGHFYGFPVHSVPGFKIGKYHHRHETVNPDAMDRDCHAEDEEVLRAGIRRYFPDANGPTMAMKTCLFTNSPDEHFILDRHPRHAQAAIAAGFSGHGFKFCSVVGEIMTELVLDGQTRLNIRRFRYDRPAIRRMT
ncbi:MAG TPA: N-methyl-L-tryptophan oxidase [Haliangium sp.]|nr:N-methyl-L-tryptophan oxidase [Haliangium sp.]